MKKLTLKTKTKVKIKEKKPKYVRLGLTMSILLFSLHALIFLVLTPIYEACQTDIVVPVAICEVIRGVIDIIDTVIRILGFAIIAIVFFMGTRKKLPFVLIYIGAIFFRCMGAIVMSYIFNHELQLGEIFMSAFTFALDIIFLGIALIIISGFTRSYRKNTAVKKKLSNIRGRVTLNSKELYPFGKMFNSQNLLQSCYLILGIYLSLIRIANRSVAVINQGFTQEFLYIESKLALFCGYGVDILTFLIAYGVACLLTACLYKSYMRKKTAYEIFCSTSASIKEETVMSEDTTV